MVLIHPQTEAGSKLHRSAPPSLVRASFGLINRAAAALDAAVLVGLAQLMPRLGVDLAGPLTVAQSLIVGLAGAAAFTTVLNMFGAYKVERYGSVRCAVLDLGFGLAVAAVCGGLILRAFEPDALSHRAWLAGWACVAFAGLLMGRALVAGAVRSAARHGQLRRRTAVVGEGPAAYDLLRRLAEHPQDFDLVGVFSDDGRSLCNGGLRSLLDVGQRSQIDLIVLAIPLDDPTRIFRAAEQVQWISADIVAPVDTPWLFIGSRLLTQVAGTPVLQLAQHPFKGSEGVVKVVQDYLVAGVALVALAPLMLLCAALVALQGPGPVLFRQNRLGFNGRPFQIFKFRTMTVDPDDDGSVGVTRGDARITPIGAFLRQTSLDELPQLFNVLRGEMSIVGPRPHVPNMQVGEGAYAETVRAYSARHRIKPGITGWAQINGMRGGIDSPEKARRGVELDLFYIRHWSLALDLKIMLLTLARHMSGPQVF